MSKCFYLGILLVFSQACKFGKPSDTFLLTDGGCLEWSLVSCESNLEALQNEENNAVVIRLCESGKGLIKGEAEYILIDWKIENVVDNKSLCWIDGIGDEYCYTIQLLTNNKLVLYKDNDLESGYKKRVVCTYKPLERF